MSALRAWALRFGELFRKERRDRELAAEIESHLQMHVEDNLRAGMTPEQARREARLKFGGVESTKEKVRDQRGIPWLETFLQDVRFGLRMLRKNPGFTAVAVLTLALGIGANTAVFSVVSAVLLRPLPYLQPDRIVRLVPILAGEKGISTTTTVPKFVAWREQADVFQSVAAYDFSGPGINVLGTEFPEQVKGIHVSADYFQVFDASLALGRTFTPAEDLPGGPRLAVISNGLWRNRFQSDPSVIGRTMDLAGDSYEVIGVLAASFVSDPPADLYLTMRADPNSRMNGNTIFVAARLKPGITIEQAAAAMKIAAERFRRKHPEAMDPEESATALPLLDTIVGDFRTSLLFLLGAVLFVLVIACANVANLQLGRSTTRKREMAIRTALGATRGRIIRQLFTETVILSFMGGALGLLFGYAGVRILLAHSPTGVGMLQTGLIPRVGQNGSQVALDARVLLLTFIVIVLSAILSGTVPALIASRLDLSQSIHEGDSPANTGLDQRRFRSFLAATEIALTLVLLAGASLMIRAFMTLRNVDSGFDGHNVLTTEMSLAGSRFVKTLPVARLVDASVQRIESVPGVTAAAYTISLPLEPSMGLSFSIAGRPEQEFQNVPVPQWRDVSPHFFEVFKIPLLRGRLIADTDSETSEPVVLINEAMAKQYWPGDNPIGQRITIAKGMDPSTDEPPRKIIGIVGDVRNFGLDHKPVATMYLPVAQVVNGLTALINHNIPVYWVVRTARAPYSFSNEIQRELRIATGGLPVGRIRSMDDVLAVSTRKESFLAMLISIFAAIALSLAATGVFSVMNYAVQQRKHEIGIRMALGASAGSVGNMVLLQSLRTTTIGISIGLALSFVLVRWLKNVLNTINFGQDYYSAAAQRIEGLGLLGFAVVILLLGAVSLLAAHIPARRATKVDPMMALRYE